MYTFQDIIVQLINSMIFQCVESFAGALWFIPVLIFASSLFGTLIYFGRKINYMFKINFGKHLFLIFMCFFFIYIGRMLNVENIYTTYHLQTAILVIPIYIIAYYVRNIKNLDCFLKWYFFIPAIFFLYLCVNKFNWNIELSINLISGYKFYVISIVGIYCCLYLAKMLLNTKLLKKYFILIGKFSFEIMALHFLVFKLIDYVYALIIHTNANIYGVFPCAFNNNYIICTLYILLGTIIPATIIKFFTALKSKFNNNNNNNQ